MADGLLLTWRSQIVVSGLLRRRIVAIEVGASVAVLDDDAIDANIGRPVKGVVSNSKVAYGNG